MKGVPKGILVPANRPLSDLGRLQKVPIPGQKRGRTLSSGPRHLGPEASTEFNKLLEFVFLTCLTFNITMMMLLNKIVFSLSQTSTVFTTVKGRYYQCLHQAHC